MPLGKDRLITPGQTSHAHEREAFEFVVRELPDTDPYRLWAFVDLVDPSGRRYDIDLLIIGYHALYLVEVKSHPGVLTGDEVDWQFTLPGGGRSLIENPLRTTTHKARVLGSLLDKQFARDTTSRALRRPWVQPLVFLSNKDLDVRLQPNGRMHVVTRETFRQAITHGEFPGAPESLRDHPVNRPTGVATHRALLALGLRPSVAALKVEGLFLRELLEDGRHYQDHLGVHQAVDNLTRRVRSFLIPAGTTAERREQILRAAHREAQHLTALSDHKNILHLVDYVADGPLGGPCVILEHVEDAVPLDVFLRATPDLTFDERISIIEQIAQTLEFCHRKQIVHRGLNPRAILVRRAPATGAIEVRLYNFQLAAAEDSTGTVHLTALTQDQSAVYLAPEVLEDPSAADSSSDVFSLGAVAYHVLTGRPPGTTLAERAELLAGGSLSVAAARDDLAGVAAARVSGSAADDKEPAGTSWMRSIDEVVAFATAKNPHERADSAIVWLNLLLEVATTPGSDSAESFVNPLEARPGDRLSDDMTVEDILGTGSTARVLRVKRGDAEFALKVALAPDLDERVRSEARVLQSLATLKSDRIVTVVEELTLADRACLLMADAGETLATLIARDGPPSLDFARRWGEDLLRALESLEDKAIQHRDIKPANLGILPSQAKKKRNLLLFDFSLSAIPDTAITAGTPVYRDPFLDQRGRWDAAADRWATAVTLHEMLTGARPRWGDVEGPAVATNDEIRIAGERFDAGVRSRLLGFFKRALARDVASRYPNAEQMRVEWVGCFATASWTEVSDGVVASTSADLARLEATTPVAALPLSARAKNAIDRAGMTTLGELLLMPHNRLSSTRGVGRTTSQEILKFLDDARAAVGERLALAEQPPFFPNYNGTWVGASCVRGLSSDAVSLLDDAGLGTLPGVASAPRSQVEHILSGHPGAASILRDFMQASSARFSEAAVPATLEDLIEAFVPSPSAKRSKVFETTAQLLGLEPVLGAAADEHCDEAVVLARRLGVTRAAVYASLAKAKERWQENPNLDDLQAKVGQILDRLGHVGPINRIAEGLAADIPHRAGAGQAGGADRIAEALVRVAAETSDSLVQGRIEHRLWLADSQAALGVARDLGVCADELAAREPIPSTEEVKDALGTIVKDTALASLALDRLVALAADASRNAARSARLEIYPRGLPAARAIALSAGAMAPHLTTPEAIRRIVRARYPEAEIPPERPELDDLVRPLGLEWDETKSAYARPGALPPTSFETRHVQRLSTTHTSHRPPRPSKESQEALEFDAKLRLAIEKRNFRVLDVTAGYDQPAAQELEGRFGARNVSIETLVLAEAASLMDAWHVESQVVYDADRAGTAAGDDWENLRRLMKEAAKRAFDSLFAPGATSRALVLTQLGILARYGLEDVVAALVERAQRDDAPAIFLVNPTDDAATPATIDAGTKPLPVPLTSHAQRLRVPEPWIRNLHRGGAF